ncbi:hypothetical protein [Roseobacter sp. EG26]|uniref:hypothetical protein n=1 Tax=Roseobacter sp. EG26 TaxID=3412477 RepID=UPI003CE4B087
MANRFERRGSGQQTPQNVPVMPSSVSAMCPCRLFFALDAGFIARVSILVGQT